MKMTDVKNAARFLTTAFTFIFLAGCNSADPTLGVAQPGSQLTDGENAGAATNNSDSFNVYFAPIVGAPVSSITSLSTRLSAAAPENGIALQPSASRTIDHEIRGYFSAFSENGSTTIVHVWDVFDRQSQRVHRIQGQESFAGTSNDPWQSVPPSAMAAIADNVLQQYATWRNGKS